MCSSVVANVVSSPITTTLTICQKCAVGRDVFAYEYLSKPFVGSVDVTAQFMFAVKAFFVILANRTRHLGDRPRLSTCQIRLKVSRIERLYKWYLLSGLRI